MEEIIQQLKAKHRGLKVFKDDPELLDEVFYNGCGFYQLDRNIVAHFYTDKLSKSTFMLSDEPTPSKVWDMLNCRRTANGCLCSECKSPVNLKLVSGRALCEICIEEGVLDER